MRNPRSTVFSSDSVPLPWKPRSVITFADITWGLQMIPRTLAAILIFTHLCVAQSITGGGTIQGTVKDSSGSAIANAKLSITHLETGTTLQTESNSDGYFATPPIKIGK